MSNVPAKIDTGADTGAIHCTMIKEKVVKGKDTLMFSPFDRPDLVIVSNDFTIKKVKSSNGEACQRYFVTTTIEVQGKNYPIQLSLADRTEMTWPVLIGRKFLGENNFLVDVTRGTTVLFAEKDKS